MRREKNLGSSVSSRDTIDIQHLIILVEKIFFNDIWKLFQKVTVDEAYRTFFQICLDLIFLLRDV